MYNFGYKHNIYDYLLLLILKYFHNIYNNLSYKHIYLTEIDCHVCVIYISCQNSRFLNLTKYFLLIIGNIYYVQLTCFFIL